MIIQVHSWLNVIYLKVKFMPILKRMNLHWTFNQPNVWTLAVRKKQYVMSGWSHTTKMLGVTTGRLILHILKFTFTCCGSTITGDLEYNEQQTSFHSQRHSVFWCIFLILLHFRQKYYTWTLGLGNTVVRGKKWIATNLLATSIWKSFGKQQTATLCYSVTCETSTKVVLPSIHG